MTNELVLPNTRTTSTHELIGMTLAVITLGLSMFLFYGIFFDRDNYYNRKALYEYLQHNPLPKPDRIGEFTVWSGDKYNLTLTDNDHRWYVSDSKSCECIICAFKAGIMDRYRYNKVLQLLEEAK